MKDFIDTIRKLFEMKSVITLVTLGLFVYAVLNGIIEGTFLESVIMMVFSFFFGTQYQKGRTAIEQQASKQPKAEDQATTIK